ACGQSYPVMGSTGLVLLIQGNRAARLWGGDSRCYRWGDRQLFQLTREHSLAQQLVETCQLSSGQAALHPASHALTRAVGAAAELELDVVEFEVLRDDRFLLCSDGIHQASPPAVLGVALGAATPARAVDLLVDFVMQGD